MYTTTHSRALAWHIEVDPPQGGTTVDPPAAHCLPEGLVCAECAVVHAVDLHLVIDRVDYAAHCVITHAVPN